MAASVAIQNAKVRGQVVDRFIRESVRSFQVPDELACDRAVLGDPADAAYVEKMNDFLLRVVGRHPLMTDERSRNIVVRETDPRHSKTSFALLAGTGRLVSFQDYTYFREPGAHETDVRLSGRFEDRNRLLITFDEFPEVSKCVASIIPPRGLAVRCPRVAYYFVAVVQTQDDSVKKRYAISYVLEWAQAVAAYLTGSMSYIIEFGCVKNVAWSSCVSSSRSMTSLWMWLGTRSPCCLSADWCRCSRGPVVCRNPSSRVGWITRPRRRCPGPSFGRGVRSSYCRAYVRAFVGARWVGLLSMRSFQTRCCVVCRQGKWRYQAKRYVSPVGQCVIFWTYLRDVQTGIIR